MSQSGFQEVPPGVGPSTFETRLSFGVVVPTFKRPADLLKCLNGLAQQERLPDDIIITVRDIDVETHQTLADYETSLPLRVICLDVPGLIAACNAALAVCRTNILGFLDDDAVPHPDWSSRILKHYESDPELGGVGGRDVLYDGGVLIQGRSQQIGKVSWFGRVSPNQHLGCGASRDVDFLKGTNMSFRAAAFEGIYFDKRLRGDGLLGNHDLAFSLAVKKAGWRIVYDPKVLVNHFVQSRSRPRPYVDLIRVSDKESFRNWAFNEVVALWGSLSMPRRIIFVVWSLFVGTRHCPGIVQAIRFTPKLGFASWQRLVLAQQGKIEAFRYLPWRAEAGPAERVGAGKQ